jgi:hypothetical protein
MFVAKRTIQLDGRKLYDVALVFVIDKVMPSGITLCHPSTTYMTRVSPVERIAHNITGTVKFRPDADGRLRQIERRKIDPNGWAQVKTTT